jgi:riboflavin synthase
VFTGLVEDIGTVVRATHRSDALMLSIRPRRIAVSELAVGESVCHDGACLTVTDVDAATYSVVAGAETLARTTLAAARVGGKLNLERAVRVGDRLGGHWVAGHVDGTGELAARRDLGANLVLEIRAAADLMRYVVVKGSIAVAGVSLTVNTANRETFSVAIIPHTLQETTLGDLSLGDRVNLETDIVGKYIEKLVEGRS